MAVRPIRILRRCPATDGLHAGLPSLSAIPIRVVDLVHRGRCRARGKLKKKRFPCVSRVAAAKNARYFWSTTTNVVPWFGATRTFISLELPRKTRPKVWLQQDVRKKQTIAKYFTRTAPIRPKSIRHDFKCRSRFRFRGLCACLAVPTVDPETRNQRRCLSAECLGLRFLVCLPEVDMKIRLLTAVALIVLSPVAAAQCPNGIPSGGNPGCVPPDVYYGSQPNSDPPPLPKERWKTRWGAIAIGSTQSGGGLGFSSKMDSKRQAEKPL